MPDSPPVSMYRAKLQETQVNIDRAATANHTSLRAVVLAVALVVLLLYGVSRHKVPAWCVALPIPAIAVAGRWYGRNRDRWLRLIRLRGFYERGIARAEDRWHSRGFSGEEYRTGHHVYDSDLQILGKGSLYELLCTVRTGIGRRRLAEHLLEPCGLAEAKARQEAVRELAPMHELRERIALLGKFEFEESSWEVFSSWIRVPPQTAPLRTRAGMFVSAIAIIALAIAGAGTSIPWSALMPWCLPFLAFGLSIALWYRKSTGALNDAASRVGSEIGVVREGMELIAGLSFRSARLAAIQQSLAEANAGSTLRHLQRLTNVLAECEKPLFDYVARVLNVRTQICFEIENWKLRHGGYLEAWLDAWGDIEALSAIAGYAAEHPGDPFPELVEGSSSFTGRGVGHPLIPPSVCVRNDIVLDSANSLYVISGSNMAGKSTLLRSIGLNVVLAQAGAPVRAESLRLTTIEVFASLSIVDSVLEGKSKFLAEVERVRCMLERAREAPVLFLIDEILSGTNSRDRRVASEAVVRGLLSYGAIGALSTHDLALTEIAELPGIPGSNVHMGARPGQDDPMAFDYVLKPGVTTETNALAIAAMMGVDFQGSKRPDSASE